MPKPYPEEFREDVVRVARNRGPDVTLEQVAADFDVQSVTLSKWMRRADIDDGGETRNDHAGECGTTVRASADQATGAGERGPAPGHGPWTWQCPARRALERDEGAVGLWKKDVWQQVE